MAQGGSFLTSERGIVAVRWILGVQCVLSGLNWWYKLLPFPNMFEEMGPAKSPIVPVMIETGWMFTTAKVIELSLGISLLLNRYSVLMLLLAFPILMMTFLLDAIPFFAAIPQWLSGEMTGRNMWAATLDMVFFGGAVFLMQGYLMLEWVKNYQPMFVRRPDDAEASISFDALRGGVLTGMRWAAIIIGGMSTLWFIGMVHQWIVPWHSLALLAPSHP